MSPENRRLEDVFPTEMVTFRGHVSFQWCIPLGDDHHPKSSGFCIFSPPTAGRDEHLGTHEGYACWCQGPPGMSNVRLRKGVDPEGVKL